MNKLILNETMKDDFFQYLTSRIYNQLHNKTYNYITKKRFNILFNYFVKAKMTVQIDCKSYWYKGNEKNYMCCKSDTPNENIEDMTEQLYHELFCKIEWCTRCLTENIEVITQTFGSKLIKELK